MTSFSGALRLVVVAATALVLLAIIFSPTSLWGTGSGADERLQGVRRSGALSAAQAAPDVLVPAVDAIRGEPSTVPSASPSPPPRVEVRGGQAPLSSHREHKNDPRCPGFPDITCRGDINMLWSSAVVRLPPGKGPFLEESDLGSPAITGGDIFDTPAIFVADPYIIQHEGVWYMYSEVLDSDEQEGVVGLAVSEDGGRTWRHHGIVLREDYHVSFPFVLFHKGKWFMTLCPTGYAPKPSPVWLYTAPSPLGPWKRDRKLFEASQVHGFVIDPVWHADPEGGWFLLFSEDATGRDRGFWAPDITGPFKELEGSGKAAIRHSGRLVPREGGGLWAFHHTGSSVTARALELNRTSYKYTGEAKMAVRAWPGAPKWRSSGMHTYNAVPLPDGGWMIAVDGWWNDSGGSIFQCLQKGGTSAECQPSAEDLAKAA